MSKYYFNKYQELTNGITELYPFQLGAINNLLDGNHTLSIAPTGKGKSIIYQLAAQELGGITIVVSPLTALIKEQVQVLKNTGVHALGLTSELSFLEQRTLLRTFSTNPPKILFLSPERLQNSFFRAAILKIPSKVSMVVVDEAHCISQWGIDFRPEYDQIREFITFLELNAITPVVLALTATLGLAARNDIINAYAIQPSSIFIEENFIRPELHLNFIEVEEENEKDEMIYEILATSNRRKIIIYFYSIYKCKKIARELEKRGYAIGQFYSDLDGEEKEEAYQRFTSGELQLLCATTAFGMGMNIPDIDMIIHYHIPNSIEEYYQQVGRGARDKRICLTAECILLWSEKNFDYKVEEHIESQQISFDKIKETFKKFGLEGNADKIQGIEYSNYVAQGLSLFRYLFEKNHLIKFIGEVNGTPKSILFKNENPYWNGIVERMGFGNNFIRAAENSGMTLQELISYIFEEELSGQIKTFKAREKKLFFISSYNEIPIDAAYDLIEHSIKIVEFKTAQLNSLKEMIISPDPAKYINDYFN